MADSLQGLRDFLTKYASLIEDRQKNIDTAAAEFQSIKQQDLEVKKGLKCIEGAKEHNKKKNRYKDILPYDHSRVVLNDDQFQVGADYINANCIKDHAGNFCYIASQGPMPTTVFDFWRMIWQYKIKVVIMACREIEMGKPRCQRYWPKNNEEMAFGGIKVILTNETTLSHNIQLREMIATKDGERRKISQLHFSDWPDHGAPETTEPIIELVKLGRQRNPSNQPPILVHCSAGCGRTGAIIAIDYVQKLIAARSSEIDVGKIVMKLRQQRPAMVQTREQYEFLYEVFRELVTQELNKCDPSTKEDENSTYVNMCYVRKEAKASKTVEDKNAYVNLDYNSRPMPTPRKNADKGKVILPADNLINLNTGFRRTRSLKNHETARVPALPRKLESYSNPPVSLNESSPRVPPKSPSALRDDGIKRVSSSKQSPLFRSKVDAQSKSKSLEHTKTKSAGNDDVFITLPAPPSNQNNPKNKNNVKEGILVDLSAEKETNKPVNIVKPYAITDVNKIANEYRNRNQKRNVGDGWQLSVQSGNSNSQGNSAMKSQSKETMYTNAAKLHAHSQPVSVTNYDNDIPPKLPERTPESFIILKNGETGQTGHGSSLPSNQGEDAPPMVPERTPESFIILKNGEGSNQKVMPNTNIHGESSIYNRSISTNTQQNQQDVPSPTAKHIFNAITKVRNMAKNKPKEESTSPTHKSAARTVSLDSISNPNSELVFPRRLSQKLRGPRPPPSHWERPVTNF